MFETPLLALDISDVIGLLVTLGIFFIGWIASQVTKAKPPQAPPPRRVPPPGAPPPPQGAMPEARDALNDEINDFLRRAAQKRGERGTGATPPPPPRERPAPPRERPLMPSRSEEEPVEAAVVYEASTTGSSVAQHVAEHLNTSSFAERSRHLGEEVDQADERMASHMHERFDHQVGRLRDTTVNAAESQVAVEATVTQAAPAPVAATLADMLRSPQGMRQAILLSEVLHRSEDRW